MSKDTIIVIDYGSGNLRSAAKAFEHVCVRDGYDFDIKISGNPDDVLKAGRIVLPGQGAFGDCMNGLKGIDGMVEALQTRVIDQGIPFFGICVGMQLMASRGLEHGEHDGLGWIDGEVVPMRPSDLSLKIPHMGWNEIEVSDAGRDHPVLDGIKNGEHYYFVHSFMVQLKDSSHVLAQCSYGGSVTSIIGRANMVGAQFHPEKSQEAGLALISNFLKWNP